MARRPGSTKVPCKGGDFTIVVKQPDHLAIDGPAELSLGESAYFSLKVLAGDTALDVGDAEPDWTLPPGVPELDRCSHMLGSCAPRTTIRLRPAQAGTFTIGVSFGQLSATKQVVVK